MPWEQPQKGKKTKQNKTKQNKTKPPKTQTKPKQKNTQPREWETAVANDATGLRSKILQTTHTTQHQKKQTTQLKNGQKT